MHEGGSLKSIRTVYKLRRGAPYPKVLTANSPDYTDPEAVRDTVHKFRRALTRAVNWADVYSDRIDELNQLMKEKDSIILEERGKTSENVSQLIKAFLKKLDSAVSGIRLTQTPATVTATDNKNTSNAPRTQYDTEIDRGRIRETIRLEMDEFQEKVDSLKTLEIKELGDFMYDIIIRSDALGGVDRPYTFVLWKKLVVSKFKGVAKEKWEQRM